MTAPLFSFLTAPGNRWQLWFWLLVLVAAPIESALGATGLSVGEALGFRLIGMISKMLAGYLIAYYLFPDLFYRRRYWWFAAGLLLAGLVFPVLARALNIYVAEALMVPEMEQEPPLEILTDFGYTFSAYYPRVFPIAFWFTFLKIGIDQVRSGEQLTKLREEKAVAELSFLKAQIHPHFLFNTLNNLYTLTLEKSDEAPEVVVKLAEMLDYLLYKCQAERVSVRQEVTLLRHYLGLERIRYGDRLDLSFLQEIDDPSARIAPLLLLSPVENAFKHGASGATERPAIRIELRVRAGRLHLHVWNTKPPTPPRDDRDYTAGIGLRNVRSQLELTYPRRHELIIAESPEAFTLDLRIDL